MRKISLIFIAFLTLGLLASCGKQDNAATQKSSQSSSVKRKENRSSRSSKVSKQNSSTESSVSKSKTSTLNSSSSSSSSSQSKLSEKGETMDFNQIKEGNYSSLLGNWYLLKATARNQDITSSDEGTLTITKSDLVSTDAALDYSGLNDQNGIHALKYRVSNGALIAELADQQATINYQVTFYPVGTTSDYQSGDSETNTQNIIVVWSSNNNYTEVFAQNMSN